MSTDFITGYLAANDHNSRAIRLQRIFIDLCNGNLPQAVVLSQIVFWHGNDSTNGLPRMKVVKDGNRWIAKTNQEWETELGIPESTIRAAISVLINAGLLLKRVWKFNGETVTHIRLDLSVFELMLKNQDTIKDRIARIKQSRLLESSNPSNIDDNIDEKKKIKEHTPPTADVDTETDSSKEQEPSVSHILSPLSACCGKEYVESRSGGRICMECGTPERLEKTRAKPLPPNSAAPPFPLPMDHKAVKQGLCVALGVDPVSVGNWGIFDSASKALRNMGAPPIPDDFAKFREWDLTVNPNFLSKNAQMVVNNWPLFKAWQAERQKKYGAYMVPLDPADAPVVWEDDGTAPATQEEREKQKAEVMAMLEKAAEEHSITRITSEYEARKKAALEAANEETAHDR